jgi:hypothetical protein
MIAVCDRARSVRNAHHEHRAERFACDRPDHVLTCAWFVNIQCRQVAQVEETGVPPHRGTAISRIVRPSLPVDRPATAL